jgi:hypothetical protein
MSNDEHGIMNFEVFPGSDPGGVRRSLDGERDIMINEQIMVLPENAYSLYTDKHIY